MNLKDQKWMDSGVDIWLIRENLKLTFEERVEQHQDMLALIDELQQLGQQNHARSEETSQIIDS